ncbi:phosphatidylinositol polyphosphate 5-phosphatase type IV isoform X2 [Siniperca chuatsi]|uniref:phosphatidylinositol polyphosphate 5-phosphatase type IV isoform X2 n=1 Tax=Siniperca chuatsi TaxID=119488 RepID=UPI001CE12844|nr:phosphatidylinositol polyphosphate 5-phosphatase type IV isoform X2 [Siniperca chuatsi]
MTENGEDSPLHQSCEAPGKGDSVVNDSRALKTSLVDAIPCKEHNDPLKPTARNAEGEVIPYQPRPPYLPRLSKSSRSGSVDETVRTRRLRNSQESLSDPAETGSSADSLKEDQTVPAQGEFVLSGAATIRNDQDSNVRPLSAVTRGAPVFRDGGSSLSDYERRPPSQQSDPTDNQVRPTKMRLSPVQPTGPLPVLEKSFASATLRAANRIDRDCLDYAMLARENLEERLHRNLSDSRLLENMGSDSASVNSMRSTYSVLSPIRPQDVRNRSFLEGSLLGSGALLGAEELDRYFPNRRVGIYIATWNMQGEKGLPANLDDLLLPTDSEFAQDFYIIGVQEGCPDRREWETRLQETLGPYYVMLYAASHGVLYLTVFVRRDLIWFCSAGDAKVYERILDYNKIVEALALPKGLPDTNPYRSTPSDVTTRFDQVFWFGDFNFRLGKARVDVETIINRTVVGCDMGSLLEHDQLYKEMKDGSIFKGFQEAPIHFFPTYKFDIGCDIYDTTSKQRTPSYTDRIVFRNRHADDIKVVKYTSCSGIKTSDHRPVIGVFQVKLRPGRDNIPLGAGQFDRGLYLEGIRRRITRELKRREAMKNQSSSTICTIS